MALSGSYTYAIPYTGGALSLKLAWSATQNVANNTSTVKVTAYFVRGKYGTLYAGASAGWVMYIDGTKYSGSTVLSGSANTTKTIATETKTITHNADGSRTFGISYGQNLNLTFSGHYLSSAATGSRNFTLNKIPRASTFGNIGTLTFGSNNTVPVTINSASSSFNNVITVNFNGKGLQTWTNLKGGSNNLTLNSTVNTALGAALSSATSATLSWSMSTFDSGGSKVGSTTSKNSSVVLNSSDVAPVAGELTWTEGTESLIGFVKDGTYVQGMSSLIFSVTGSSATHGATVTSQTVNFEGSNYKMGATTDVIQGSAGATATLVVTDSRGMSTLKDFTVPVVAYTPPIINSLSFQRADAQGNYKTDGTNVVMSYDIQSTDVPMVTGSNTISMLVKANIPQVDNSYEPRQLMNKDLGSTHAVATETLSGQYLTDKAYGFNVQLVDVIGGTNSQTNSIDVAKIIMGWGKYNVGIGTIPDPDHGVMDIDGDTYTSGNILYKENTSVILPRIADGSALTWSSGWHSYAGNGNVSLSVTGRVATLSMMITHSNALGASSGTIATLPDWALPANKVNISGAVTNSAVTANYATYGVISTAGDISFVILATAGREARSVFVFSTTYPTAGDTYTPA